MEWYPTKGMTSSKRKEFHLKEWNPLKRIQLVKLLVEAEAATQSCSDIKN